MQSALLVLMGARMSVSFKIGSIPFPVALVFLAGWLAMLAVQNNDSTAWQAFGWVLLSAIFFQIVWLAAVWSDEH